MAEVNEKVDDFIASQADMSPEDRAASRLNAATSSAEALGVPADAAQRATDVARSVGGQSTRFYHDSNHFTNQAAGSANIVQTLTERGISQSTAEMMANIYNVAGRDHDSVYTTADKKIPDGVDISAYVDKDDKGNYTIKKDLSGLTNEQKQNLEIAEKTFGFEPGQKLNPYSGQNEFLSALHSLDSNPGITPQSKIAIASLTASTIPFESPDSINQLADRVSKIEIDGKPALTIEQVHAIGLTSADFANRDVASFGDNSDKGKQLFENNTRSLLRESGADLTDPKSILEKTAGMRNFMSNLGTDMSQENPAKTVFRNYTFILPDGKTTSLLTPQELDAKNEVAKTQINSTVQTLSGIQVAAKQAEMNGETKLPGGADGEEIARRADEINKQIRDLQPPPPAPVVLSPPPPSGSDDLTSPPITPAPPTPEITPEQQRSLNYIGPERAWTSSRGENRYPTLTKQVFDEHGAELLKKDLENVGVPAENINIKTQDGKTTVSVIDSGSFKYDVLRERKLPATPIISVNDPALPKTPNKELFTLGGDLDPTPPPAPTPQPPTVNVGPVNAEGSDIPGRWTITPDNEKDVTATRLVFNPQEANYLAGNLEKAGVPAANIHINTQGDKTTVTVTKAQNYLVSAAIEDQTQANSLLKEHDDYKPPPLPKEEISPAISAVRKDNADSFIDSQALMSPADRAGYDPVAPVTPPPLPPTLPVTPPPIPAQVVTPPIPQNLPPIPGSGNSPPPLPVTPPPVPTPGTIPSDLPLIPGASPPPIPTPVVEQQNPQQQAQRQDLRANNPDFLANYEQQKAAAVQANAPVTTPPSPTPPPVPAPASPPVNTPPPVQEQPQAAPSPLPETEQPPTPGLSDTISKNLGAANTIAGGVSTVKDIADGNYTGAGFNAAQTTLGAISQYAPESALKFGVTGVLLNGVGDGVTEYQKTGDVKKAVEAGTVGTLKAGAVTGAIAAAPTAVGYVAGATGIVDAGVATAATGTVITAGSTVIAVGATAVGGYELGGVIADKSGLNQAVLNLEGYKDIDKRISAQGNTIGNQKDKNGLIVISDTQNKELSDVVNKNPDEANKLSSDPALAAKGITNGQDPAYLQKQIDAEKQQQSGFMYWLKNNAGDRTVNESKLETAQIELNNYKKHFNETMVADNNKPQTPPTRGDETALAKAKTQTAGVVGDDARKLVKDIKHDPDTQVAPSATLVANDKLQGAGMSVS